MGKTLFEMPAFWLGPIDKAFSKIVKIEGEAAVAAAFQQGRGVILLSPHLGAWEIVNLYLAKHYPLFVMYKPSKMRYFQKLIINARQRLGSTLVPTNRHGVKTLYRALENGHVTVILPDQNPGNSGGEYADFFGHPALTMTLVNRLAQKNQPPIFFMYAERLNKAEGYIIRFKPANPLISENNPVISAAALNQGLEACIKEIPHQYLWAYKRFKHQASDKTSVY